MCFNNEVNVGWSFQSTHHDLTSEMNYMAKDVATKKNHKIIVPLVAQGQVGPSKLLLLNLLQQLLY